jgi:hypothetical protein
MFELFSFQTSEQIMIKNFKKVKKNWKKSLEVLLLCTHKTDKTHKSHLITVNFS